MSISRLARSIAPSPTFALNEEARMMRERGEPVINMGIGEPKNKTPITAILSSAARLSGGEVKYTPPEGMPSLKKAIIRYTEENYDRVRRTRKCNHIRGSETIIIQYPVQLVEPTG